LRPQAQINVNPLFPAAGTSGKALYSPQVWNFHGVSRENYARGGLQPSVKKGHRPFLTVKKRLPVSAAVFV